MPRSCFHFDKMKSPPLSNWFDYFDRVYVSGSIVYEQPLRSQKDQTGSSIRVALTLTTENNEFI